MTRVLVTGATGFVGRHLVESLRGDGCEVIAAVRDPSRLSGISADAATELDLAKPSTLKTTILESVACVFHLAARVHQMDGNPQDDQQFASLNAHATANLALRAARCGVRRFVFLSSIKVNGDKTADKPFGPNDPPAPTDAYGRSKLLAETELKRVAEETALEVVIVRPPLVYGPHVGANFRRLLALVDRELPLPLAAVKNQRSMINVWNLVSALKRVGTHPLAPGRTWLVSDGDDLSTPRLLSLMAAALGRKIHLFSVPMWSLRSMGALSGRSAEIERLISSLQVESSMTRELLDWRPAVAVEEGIARTATWLKGSARAYR